MKRMVPRTGDSDPGLDAATMGAILLSLPRPTRPADAIVVLPGQGEDIRLISAIKAWDSTPEARFLLVAGSWPGEDTWWEPTIEKLKLAPFNLKRTEGVIIQPEAEITPEQAAWILERVEELGISSLDLHVTPYHLPRAYCTILNTLLRAGVWIPLTPCAVEVWPDEVVPEQGKTPWELMPFEFARFPPYQEKGDMVDKATLWKYLIWLRRTNRYMPV